MDRSYQGHTHMQQRQCSNANDRHACFFGAALASRPWSVCIPDHDSLDSRDGVIIPGSRVHYVCVCCRLLFQFQHRQEGELGTEFVCVALLLVSGLRRRSW